MLPYWASQCQRTRCVTVCPAPSVGATSMNDPLEALQQVREVLSSEARAHCPLPSDVGASLAIHRLALACGASTPKPSTCNTIRAVVDRLDGRFLHDQEACEEYDVSRAAFKLWKHRVYSLVLHEVVDSLNQYEVIEFSAFAACPPKPTFWSLNLSGDLLDFASVLGTNKSRALLRTHARTFNARNGSKADYEGWISQLHPENVALDRCLKREGCEHRTIWEEATGSAGDHPGLSMINLSVGAATAIFKISLTARYVGFVPTLCGPQTARPRVF